MSHMTLIRHTNLVKIPNLSIGYHPARAITAAAIAHGLFAYVNHECDKQGELYEKVGTSCDRWMGGAMIVATELAKVVERVLDYDRYSVLPACGVFTYDQCDPLTDLSEGYYHCCDLPAFVMQAIEPRAWYHISENWMVPTEVDLEVMFRAWCAINGLPCVPKPKVAMACKACGSTEVTQDATVTWDVESQSWMLADLLGSTDCKSCAGEANLVERPLKSN